MKPGDRVTGLLDNRSSNSPNGFKVEGSVEAVETDADTGQAKRVQVRSGLGVLVWLDVEKDLVIASPHAEI